MAMVKNKTPARSGTGAINVDCPKTGENVQAPSGKLYRLKTKG
jgi:hypothetical protein